MEEPRPVRAVIFDLGHTLYDLQYDEALEGPIYEAVRRRLMEFIGPDVPDPAALRAAISQRFLEDWKRSLASGKLDQPPTDDLIDEALRGLGIALAPHQLREVGLLALADNRFAVRLDPETPGVLRALGERGLRLGVVSNTYQYGEVLRQRLAADGLLPLLASAVFSSEVGHRKPHPSLFERALADLAVQPEDALFVGDSVHDDILGAQAIGMRAVLSRQYRQDEPERGQPDAVISHLRELPALLDGLGPSGRSTE